MIGPGSLLNLPPETASIANAREFVRAQVGSAVASERADDIVLVVSELVSNAVEHGTGGDIQVQVAPADDGYELVVASESLELPHIPDAPAAADELRGRGLHIVVRLSDAVSVDASGGVVSVTCHFAGHDRS